MTPNFSYAVCPVCQGAGIKRQAEGNLTCSACAGRGSWLITPQGNSLYFAIPEILDPSPSFFRRYRKTLLYLSGGLVWLLFFLLAATILVDNRFNFLPLFWGRGWQQFGVGLSGLIGAWLLSLIEKHQTSHLSLADLTSALQNGQPLPQTDLFYYSNSRLRQLLQDAAASAASLQSSQVDEAILLISLLKQPRILNLLSRLELDPDELINQAKTYITAVENVTVHSVTILAEARRRFYAALNEALTYNFPYIDLEDLLLSYTREPGRFATLFNTFQLTYTQTFAVSRWFAEDQERARKWAFWLERGRSRPGGYMNRAWTALPTPFLDRYSLDLTRLAGRGGVATVTVRNPETKQLLEILGRTEHNSAILVGEPGVGKNTLLGGLALQMLSENVPENLLDKRLVSMDLRALLADGDSTERNVQSVLEEVNLAGNVILAIPEVQGLVGTSGAALDAATLLSEAISQGNLQVVTLATHADYHRYVEANPTLANLLEVVEIKEVTPEQAIEVLEEEAPRIEQTQNCVLTYPAIEAAVNLAKRYLPEKSLPASALEIIDQAASAAHLGKVRWVSKVDIEKVVEKRTQIPVQTAQADEAQKLLHLEEELHKRIIGQDEAVSAVAGALRRARAGLHEEKRPISSFLFVGPTGVGKTETAKAVAEVFFGANSRMIRLDMSEYQDARSVYRLIGAPAADPDSFTEGGALTQPVREHPFSLILLDEIEKAFPSVLDLFLQLLDDGRLTENSGRTVSFNNAIIVATSNAGSREIASLLEQGSQGEQLTKQVLNILKQVFKPEFLNRFDAVIPFHPLTPEQLGQVTRLMLQEVIDKTKLKGYAITFADDAIATIVQKAYNPLYGARPLRRYIQEKVEGLLANKILEQSLRPGGSLEIKGGDLC